MKISDFANISSGVMVTSENCTFDYLVEQQNADDIGDRINKVLEKIEEANFEKLEGVFRNVEFNSESNLGKTKDRNRRLKNLINDFNKRELNFRPSVIGTEDIIGNGLSRAQALQGFQTLGGLGFVNLHLQYLLGYSEWRNFTQVVNEAKTACEVSGHKISDHFPDAGKMVKCYTYH